MATVTEKKPATKSIYIPRAAAGEEKTLYVSINDRTWLVPRGKTIEAEPDLYERLTIMLAAQEADTDYRESVEADARKMGML